MGSLKGSTWGRVVIVAASGATVVLFKALCGAIDDLTEAERHIIDLKHEARKRLDQAQAADAALHEARSMALEVPPLIAVPAAYATRGPAQLVAHYARTHVGDDVAVIADHVAEVDAMMEAVLAAIPSAEIATGKSAITHAPWMIRLSNQARILGRIQQHDDTGIGGLHPDVVWWGGEGATPGVVAALVRHDTVGSCGELSGSNDRGHFRATKV